MKLVQFYLLAIVVSLLLIHAGCSSSDDEIVPDFDDNLPVLNPGEMIPMKTKVAIVTSGTYLLPIDASRLTTRCFGSVTVTLQYPNEDPDVNSCDSATGSSSQTNIVAGLQDVIYTVATSSRAEVTLN